MSCVTAGGLDIRVNWTCIWVDMHELTLELPRAEQ